MCNMLPNNTKANWSLYLTHSIQKAVLWMWWLSLNDWLVSKFLVMWQWLIWHSSSSCLSQAAGLATMISTMRPDIDNMDEYVRNTTARAFAVVASALGIPSLLPFLKAVCKSKKSWQARHTGIKIVQQIAILMGCAILPHLRSLVEIIEHGQSC